MQSWSRIDRVRTGSEESRYKVQPEEESATFYCEVIARKRSPAWLKNSRWHAKSLHSWQASKEVFR